MDNREIDKLVAEKVMGWYSCTDANGNKWWAPSAEEFPIWLKPQKNFEPSTNIQDAWLVVDKLKIDFSSVEIFIVDGMTNVIITERFPSGHLKDKYQGYEKSATLSICKAALKAIEVKE